MKRRVIFLFVVFLVLALIIACCISVMKGPKTNTYTYEDYIESLEMEISAKQSNQVEKRSLTDEDMQNVENNIIILSEKFSASRSKYMAETIKTLYENKVIPNMKIIDVQSTTSEKNGKKAHYVVLTMNDDEQYWFRIEMHYGNILYIKKGSADGETIIYWSE